MIRDEAAKFIEKFRVPGRDRTYILGSFASHATLYSQQVRALNLIHALCTTNAIRSSTKVAVIGGGAAGLSAAAAAASKGATVVLLESLAGPMELQRNNRQRWLHPHIYDWPDEEFKDETSARLPLLNWTADYAEKVAMQIETAWKKLVSSSGRIQEHYDVEPELISIHEDTNCARVSWTDSRSYPDQVFDLVVLAVGFGLEEETAYSRSYWSEDSIDGDFRRGGPTKSWLVSGSGDGALTDLMRLCIRRFRHSEIATMFSSLAHYEGVKYDLRQIHTSPEATDSQWLSDQFLELPAPGFEDIIRPRLRQGLKIVLSAERPLFGLGSSILNRLVVLILLRIGAFNLAMERTEDVKPNGDGFDVMLGHKALRFDHVLKRHGPKPSALNKDFFEIDRRSDPLRAHWKAARRDDETRRRLWPASFYEAASEEKEDLTKLAFTSAIQKFGVSVRKLTIYKQLRDDGNSTLSYEVEGLSVVEGELHGLAFYYTSDVGYVGRPALDTASKALNHEWIEDEVADAGDQDFKSVIDHARDRARRLSGIVKFGKPLKPSDPPISFGLSIAILNSDALSTWEFEQFYPPEERLHFDRNALGGYIEYLAGVVWFPIGELVLKITLPARLARPPALSHFEAPEPQRKGEVVRDFILQLAPTDRPGRLSRASTWSRVPINLLGDQVRFSNPFEQTWELSVAQPRLASCYSLDWTLPSSPRAADMERIESEVGKLRRRLMNYRDWRHLEMEPRPEDKAIRNSFKELDRQLGEAYRGTDPSERFDVSMMTYDDETRRLVVVDGAVNGSDPDGELWDFWLPFGLGLAGSCLKQGDRALIYFKPRGAEKLDERTAEARPEYYLPLPKTHEREALVSVPVFYPDFDGAPELPTRYELGRQIVGILNIGSTSESTKLLEIGSDPEGTKLGRIVDLCQTFCDEVCRMVGAGQ